MISSGFSKPKKAMERSQKLLEVLSKLPLCFHYLLHFEISQIYDHHLSSLAELEKCMINHLVKCRKLEVISIKQTLHHSLFPSSSYIKLNIFGSTNKTFEDVDLETGMDIFRTQQTK